MMTPRNDLVVKIVGLCLCCWALASGNEVQNEAQPGKVQGRVVNLWGQVLPGVEVSFYRLDGERKESYVTRLTTDQEGSYSAEQLPWGVYRVKVMGRDFCCENIQPFFVPKGGSRILDIGLGLALTDGLQEIRVRGTVRGKDGVPIRNASVTFSSVFSPQRWDQTRTNEAGQYEFLLSQPGQYVLHASKPGFIAEAATIDVGSGGIEKKDIQLRPGQAQGLGQSSAAR